MKDFPWEDNLLERKTENDLKDLLKTLVAFANSAKPGHVATILIGEKDNGTAVGVSNPDNIQKKVREECDKIYPGIIWHSRIYEKDGKNCVRVEIEYSGETPHFGGSAWVRKGSETIKATDEVFQRLIELRSDKVRELSKWLGKLVSVNGNRSGVPVPRGRIPGLRKPAIGFSHRWREKEVAKLVFVNGFWATFEKEKPTVRMSEPLDKLTLSFDDNENRLKIIVSY